MNTNEKNIYIDPDIPAEQQIAFLRRSAINFKFNTFEVLKEKFGTEGIEIFKTILRKNYRQAIDKHKGKNFEEIKKLAGLPDKIFGLQLKHDYTKPDEFQYTITYCPYLEESKRRGLGMDFCDIMEEVEIEEVSKNLGEITEPTRMCKGDSKCIIRMRNTLER
ncbi:MAG: hypothetical protein A3C43_04455 [Candidatus Schekmanbacteria bacterium RIFCSPHIGHO2_02_FULL_38_11]|uniref:L-2-amino-thiazoline-4-carboxylic acid hydrolase n=1 Tax=Candidatus Schekmanbacteria bacterium RIFCSPLOWO2_12_FULL_38_15 TaxID=1817883 RepID=A0A1F7SM34_9BACT|nr:MAG: hypothetical protein A3C43_04455 [Candidatus Schekmanbacteria bacterium RIFCSPHIGHO2_02_FULL_38_11]OGL51038.1 MAG: hypothetical protein A3H37_11235 [Candidatus Schekmanbacteria bacterium RIFCSPLOWO2_02_FULL_38_14]OGL54833.1 MAG: hypothetical protein A3G31_01775 [Candidatus Schekmanbacteria bacterium RIFCSPLOWO2_12_FULL_38_15]